MSNEYILFPDMIIGYLHRGTEKLCEYRKINQNIPYFDRLDYVSVLFCEHSYVLAFEQLSNCNIVFNLSIFRVIIFELTRIMNNLLAISCMLFDIGCISPLLWCFEEREKNFKFF